MHEKGIQGTVFTILHKTLKFMIQMERKKSGPIRFKRTNFVQIKGMTLVKGVMPFIT